MVDKNQQPGEFWLTGSQVFKLMQGVQESLAGRVAILNLSSLSQNEIYNSCSNVPFTTDFKVLSDRQKAIKSANTPEIFKRIFTGGMPAIVSGKYKDGNIF